MKQEEELSLQKTFRYVEWISLAVLGIAQFCWAFYVVQFDQLIAVSFGLLALEAVLAAILPKSTGWRFAQLLLQVVVISAASALSVHQRSSLYFLVLGAKAALFLPLKQLLIVGALLFAGRIFAGVVSLDLEKSVHIHRVPMPEFYNPVIVETELKLYFAIALFTVIFLGRTVVAERRSRKAQQELAREAERLAIDLERTKIAMEINDKLGHILTSQVIQLELAGKLVQDKHLEKAGSLVEKSYDSAVQCLQELRKAVMAMRSENDKSENEKNKKEKNKKEKNENGKTES